MRALNFDDGALVGAIEQFDSATGVWTVKGRDGTRRRPRRRKRQYYSDRCFNYQYAGFGSCGRSGISSVAGYLSTGNVNELPNCLGVS